MSPIMLVGAAILLFGLGLAAGIGIVMWRMKGEKGKAGEIQSELDEYRRNVTEHFSETAQHFQAIGEQYRSLYKHMAQGAEALCDTTQSDELLGFASGKLTAIEARSEEEPEDMPEVIRDYAAEDPVEPLSTEAEPTVEAAGPDAADQGAAGDDKAPQASGSAKKAEKPAAEDVLAEKVSAAIAVGPDRTVH